MLILLYNCLLSYVQSFNYHFENRNNWRKEIYTSGKQSTLQVPQLDTASESSTEVPCAELKGEPGVGIRVALRVKTGIRGRGKREGESSVLAQRFGLHRSSECRCCQNLCCQAPVAMGSTAWQVIRNILSHTLYLNLWHSCQKVWPPLTYTFSYQKENP